jgi:hypothetical protein
LGKAEKTGFDFQNYSNNLLNSSPGVGRKVMEAAAANLTPVTLELGGKDAAILCEGNR